MTSPILELKKVTKVFHEENGSTFPAVSDFSLNVMKGQSIGIVGESGCGKSTLVRMITNLTNTTSGEILFHGDAIQNASRKAARESYRKIQMVFQDPYAVFSPRMDIGTFLTESLIYFGVMSKSEAQEEAIRLMNEVELDPILMERLPHQLSGGQLQRVVIARAISIHPELLILDEATSALDVSVQKQVLKLLSKLKEEHNLTYLVIGHDLAVVRSITDIVAVMYAGHIVEHIPSTHLVHALHPYTRELLSSVFSVRDMKEHAMQPDRASVEDSPRVLQGCPYQHRCGDCMEICRNQMPQLREIDDMHMVACHKLKDS